MVIVYCESCGKRVPEDQLQSGLALCTAENRYYCKNCIGAMPRNERENSQPTNAVHSAPAVGTLKIRARTAGRVASVEKGIDKLWLYSGAAVALVIVAFVALGRTRSQQTLAAAEAAKPTVSTPASTAAPVQTPLRTPPVSVSGAEDPTQRLRESDRQFEILREQRSSKLLDEAREFSRANPGDPWGYKDQLEKIVNSYRSTPAAEQAVKLIAGIKLPDGPRPAPIAPQVPAAAAIPPAWIGEAGADGWRPVLDGKSPPFRGVGFGLWKYENGTLVASEKVGDQTQFSFGDGEIRIRFQLDKSSWVAFSFHQTDAKPGASIGFDRSVLEPLWGKPLELLVTCRGDEYVAKFNGQTTVIAANGCERVGRIHINNAVGTIRIFSLDYRPFAEK